MIGLSNVQVRDLHRILDVYQMWAHTMFPKGQFMYTVGRVEKIARTAGVRVSNGLTEVMGR